MALFSKKNLKTQNPFGLTKDDLIDSIKEFPMSVVVRMLEEQEHQGNDPDVKVFQENSCFSCAANGFDWDATEANHSFWNSVIDDRDFDLFFKKYPEYAIYNLV